MNEKEAMAQGYQFTGIYERATKKDIVKAQAATLRKLGNKAIVVKVPDSKYSRGPRSYGWSVYWIESSENQKMREIKELNMEIEARRTQCLDLMNKYHNVLQEISKLEQQLKEKGE